MIKTEWSQQILNSIFDVIAVTDADLKIQDVNDAVTSIGYNLDDFLGRSLLDFVYGKDDQANFLKAFQIVKDDNGIDRQDLRVQIVKSDSNPYFADVSIRKIRNTSEEDFLFVLHDVDERAKARRALEEQKSIVEAALSEAEASRKKAEEAGRQLQVANEQLAKKQAATEAELAREQNFRLQQNRFGIQQRLSLMIGLLVACAIFTPYIFRLFYAVDQNMANSTGNALLLLIGALVNIVGGTFNRRQDNKKEEGEQ